MSNFWQQRHFPKKPGEILQLAWRYLAFNMNVFFKTLLQVAPQLTHLLVWGLRCVYSYAADCKQVQRQLAQALFKLSVEFRKQETRYLNKLEERKGYGRGHFGLLVEEAGVSSAMDEDPGFTDLQLAQVSQAESMVAQRDEEIRKIVETIAELAQIMKDLSVLVVEQGTILDRWEHFVLEV